MKYLVDAVKMQSIDQYTMDVVGMPSLVLMEKAAMAVVEEVLKHITKKDRILAVCGTGNNGGDGVAVARLLKELGYAADVLIIGDEKRATEQTKSQLTIAKNMDVTVYNNIKVTEYTIIIDAIFGIGLSKPVVGAFEQVIHAINTSNSLVFSVDIPSGVQASTGKVMNVAVRADYTVTFGVNKIGLLFYPGCELAGEVLVKDIGFPKKAVEFVKPDYFYYEREDLRLLPERKKYSNKGTYGKVLIIAGSHNMSGACYLSAKAACRSGAGLVKILTVEENRLSLQALLPEAIMSTYDPVNLKNKLEVDRIITELQWADSIVIGPGIGLSATSDRLVDIVLNNATVPIVIDADAITLLALKSQFVKEEDEGKYSEINLPANIIITPHIKEMSRLLHCEVEEIRDNLCDIVEKAVRGKKYVLALKDARTLVSDGHRFYVNVSGNDGMATAGSGDVLTGIISGFIAQGLQPFEATSLSVYIHGLAGDKAVEGKSKYSLIASDIIEALPLVLHE